MIPDKCRCGRPATHRAELSGRTVRSCGIHAHRDVLALRREVASNG